MILFDTVSLYASDNFSSLKCRTPRMEYVSYTFLTTGCYVHVFLLLKDLIIKWFQKKPDAGFAIF